MSSLTKFTQADGIQAACGGPRSALDFSFTLGTVEEEQERYKNIFAKMIELIALVPDQDELKITLDSQSLLLRRSEGIYIGIVATKGHPIVKSLQRMVRRAFRSMGARSPSTRPRPVGVPTAAPNAPTAPLDVSTTRPHGVDDDNLPKT